MASSRGGLRIEMTMRIVILSAAALFAMEIQIIDWEGESYFIPC